MASTDPTNGTGTGPGQMSLSADLESDIVDRLVTLQSNPGQEAVRQQYLNALAHPGSPDAVEKWKQAGERATKIAGKLQAADLFPWIHPYLSACAFESVYAGCLHTWLVSGEPATAGELNSSVKDYVRWQVKTFVTAVGGDRKGDSGGSA
jgi:hypothetical protein